MSKPRKSAAASAARAPEALKAPRAVCPISGEPLQYVQLSTGDWQVRGTGWVSTKLFPFKEHAEWFFSHNAGVPPAYPNPHRAVEVVGERAPPDPAQADVEGAIKDAERVGDGMADAVRELAG